MVLISYLFRRPLLHILFRSPKESVADLEGKVRELEGFCTEALDELDAEKTKNAQLLLAAAEK